MFLDTIQPLIAQHGYWAIFVIVMLESAGVPLPGETSLILAAVFAGATGQLDIALVIACAAGGAILGDNIGFWIGRRYGVRFLGRYGKYIHLTENRLKIGEYLFASHGAKIVFFGRFIAFLRMFAAVLAGTNNYGWGPFLFYNASGAVVWALSIGLGAFWFGDSITRISGPLGVLAFVAALVGIVIFLVMVRRQEKRMEAKLCAAVARELEPLG